MPEIIRDRITLAASPAMQDGTIEVDAENGVIRNCAVITEGTARPCNAPPFHVDGATIDDVVAAINAHNGSLRSRLTHPEVDGNDGITYTIGTIRNARKAGNSARVDIHLGQYAKTLPSGGNAWDYLINLARESPQNLGLSVVIDAMSREAFGDGERARIHQLFAADVVGDPGGNPRGLLSRSNKVAARAATKGRIMNAAQIEYLVGLGLPEGADSDAVAEFVSALDESQKSKLDELASSDSAAAASAKPDGRAALGAAEIEEITEIAKLSGLGSDFALSHIRAGTRPAAVRKAAIAAKAAESATGFVATSAEARPSMRVGQDRGRVAMRAALTDAMLLKGGRLKIEKPHELSSKYRNLRLVEMARTAFRDMGVARAAELSGPETAMLAISPRRRREFASRIGLTAGDYDAFVSDFSNSLIDAQNKAMQLAYAMRQPKWPMFCTRGSWPDFRVIYRPQVGATRPLIVTAPGEIVEYGEIADSKEQYSVVKRTAGYVYHWEKWVDDDIGLFGRVQVEQANKCIRAQDALAFSILTENADMSDTHPLFDATEHANSIEPGAAISVLELEKMQALAAAQTALDDEASPADPLDIELGVVIVPKSMASRAAQVLFGAVDPASNGAAMNPEQDKYVLVSSARLKDSTWYAAVRPGDGCETIEFSFLDGMETPQFDVEEDFDSVSFKARIIQAFGAKALDWRGMVRNGTGVEESES